LFIITRVYSLLTQHVGLPGWQVHAAYVSELMGKWVDLNQVVATRLCVNCSSI
jgi:hypothetical protein